MQRLPKEILEKPEFESYFVGAESKIDQVLSSTWLKQHTKHWTWKNYIMANTPRCDDFPVLSCARLAWPPPAHDCARLILLGQDYVEMNYLLA